MVHFAETHSNITNPEVYLNSIPDWSIFNGAFSSTKIRFSDIDGLVTINGYELRLEKKTGDAEIPQGQRIAFRDAVADGRTTVVLIRFDSNHRPISYQIFGEMNVEATCDADFLRALFARREKYARSLPPPTQFPRLPFGMEEEVEENSCAEIVAKFIARRNGRKAA